MRLDVFIRKRQESLFVLFLCLLSSEEQVDDCRAKSGRRLSSDTDFARTLTLDCSAVRDLREKCVFVVSSPSLWYFVIVAGTD